MAQAVSRAAEKTSRVRRDEYVRESVERDIDKSYRDFLDHTQELLQSLRAEHEAGTTGRGGSERQVAMAEHFKLGGNVAVEGLEEAAGQLLDNVDLLKRAVLVSGDAEHASKVCERERELRRSERDCLRRMLDVSMEMSELHARMERVYTASGKLVSTATVAASEGREEEKGTSYSDARQEHDATASSRSKSKSATDSLLRMIVDVDVDGTS